MVARSITSRIFRAPPPSRRRARFGALAVLVATLVLPVLPLIAASAHAAAIIKGDVSATIADGYARLVFTMAEETGADIRVANGIIVITFKQPVEISVERLSTAAPTYIAAARRGPEGTEIRIALAQKVTVNSMAAGEKLFVDLLPATWTGVMPGLPQDVIEDLARRVREAEKKARAIQLLEKQQRLQPIRVRVANQPTFTRYVFDLPELVPIATDRDNDKLALVFDAPLKFDLAEAQAALPPTVGALESEQRGESATVRFAFIGKVDVRTFREDKSFVVDVSPVEAKAPPEAAAPPPKPGDLPSLVAIAPGDQNGPIAPPATIPAHVEPPPAATPIKPATPAAGTPADGAVPPEKAPPPDKEPAAKAPAAAVSAPEPTPAAAAPAAAAPAAAPPAPVLVELKRQDGAMRLTFPFTRPTAGAVFRRFDTVWVVFDTDADVDVTPLIAEQGRTIRSVTVSAAGAGQGTSQATGQVIRIKLEHPRLASAGVDGLSWAVTLGDAILDPSVPVTIQRSIVGATHAAAVIPFDKPARVHHLPDPDIGDTLLVVTAPGPARGLPKTQSFVEFRALASTHGIVVQPLADDVGVEIGPDKIVIARPSGLTLSATGSQETDTPGYRPILFDPQSWNADRHASFNARQTELMQASASVPAERRAAARLDLARFYLGREFYPEAKAVLDVALADDRPSAEDPSGLVMRAVANIMMERGVDALKDLTNPAVGIQNDAALWRALAYMNQGRWVEARENFRAAAAAVATLPIELQRIAVREQMRAAIEVGDFADASRIQHDLEAFDIPREMRPALAVLSGRTSEGLGRMSEALAAYRSAAASPVRPAAAQGRLREILLRYGMKDMTPAATIDALEELTVAWRGDDTEIEALALLSRLYSESGRHRDAFMAMRTALKVRPDSPLTRRIYDEAAVSFDSLFLAGKGDALPAIEALSLFYDFRELTPIGRRGDEMIRKLADRMVAVDLLDQAAELLQHQVDHRLQGAARAQVATKLATVYLMARKPDRALEALRTTRTGDLNNELRSQRLLLEARALSDIGRPGVALEVVANLQGREAERLRADILWAAKRWREAGEQIEKMYGDRWREFAPLTDAERPDILRAAVGFVLGEDALGLQRFREKYAAKMAEGPDARVFAVIAGPLGANGPNFRTAAKGALSVDTLDQFLRDMRARFPEPVAAPPPAAGPPPPPRKAPGGDRAGGEGPTKVAGR